MRRFLPLFAPVIAAFIGFASQAPPVLASRNSSGTYSLPSGNPVVSGTTITASNENTFRSDVGTELTNSLDRGGRGAMTAALQHYAGTSSAPGITWSGDLDTGIYQAGANDMRFVTAATEYLKLATGTATFSRNVSLTPTSGVALAITPASGSAGINFTGAASTAAIVVTGGSAASAITATGGSAASGITTTGGSTSGSGITANGTGSGNGVTATGGASGVGVSGTGAAGQAGGSFANGTAATGGTRQNALVLTNGDINMSSVTNPTSTTSATNRLTPLNIPKAFGNVFSSAGAAGVNSAFNITSVSLSTSTYTVNFAGAMAAATYAVVVTSMNATDVRCYSASQGTTSFTVNCRTTAGAAIDFSATNVTFSFVVFGAQ
jgi:hypothetical protein